MAAPIITPQLLADAANRRKVADTLAPPPDVGRALTGINAMAAVPDMAMPAPNAVSSQPVANREELDRLKATGSGISQIQNPWLRGVARVADVAGSVLAPRIEQQIGGTEGHHQMLLARQEGIVGNDQANEKADAQLAESEAQTRNLDLQPQLRMTQAELAQDRLDEKRTNDEAKVLANLAQHGYAPDETNPGKLRPLRYEEMSETQQAIHDLKAAQQEQAEAQAALTKSKNDPSSPAYRQAQERIDVANRNASTAAGRLGLAGKNFELKAFGTINGSPAPGSLIDDNGNTVGTAFQRNIMPTGTERNKADMAASASEQLADIKSIMQKHPTLFGPGYGQTSEFRQWIGSQDPDAQRFLAARTIAADHLAGTFGGRSEAALTALDNAIGQFKDNPQAAIAGVDQLAKANSRFEKAGTPRTNGSKSASSNGAPKAGDVVDGYRFKGGNPAVESNWEKQ